MVDVILASGSPRRKELLSQLGIEYKVIKSEVEEVIEEGMEISQVPMELSRQKALDIFRTHGEEGRVVLGADTIVAVDDDILGKPKNREDAVRMIKRLSGRSHYVYTGFTLCYGDLNHPVVESYVCRTKVNVAAMSDEEIEEYSNSEEPLDKAGAYGIQGVFAKYITSIEGDYYNVVGLPVSMVYQNIKKLLKK